MRCKKAYEADKTRKAYDTGNCQRCYHQHCEAQTVYADSKHFCFSFIAGKHKDLSVQQEKNCKADDAQHQVCSDGVYAYGAEASHYPVFYGSQLLFRVCRHFQKHKRRLGKGMNCNACEHDSCILAASVKGGKPYGEYNCDQRSCEG